MNLRLKPLPLGTLLTWFVVSMWETPQPSHAMPPFAVAYKAKCSLCHTMVPLLNSYGRYVQRTGYAALDKGLFARTLPFWVGESVNYDSTAGAGNGTPRYAFGNLAVHAVGYLTPDVTYHAQQWITEGNQAGPLDTLWVAYNNLLRRNGHLFFGKILNPAPSPYSQTSDIDGPSASGTVVGEHNWGNTYQNRWGSKFAYVNDRFTAEAGYLLSADDLNGLTDFTPGDKTFQWKAAYARADQSIEAGFFGSSGSIPVSTGTDRYASQAAYVQLDPGMHGKPGALVIYQIERDGNPGLDAASQTLTQATTSRGVSAEVFEPLLHGNALVSFRHDFNDNGFGTLSNGNAVNLAFNVPHLRFVHGYLESNLGGDSALAGTSGGPTWKGMLWLTLPTRDAK